MRAIARRHIALAFVVIGGFTVSLFANAPGHFEPDSLWQLAQGRSGVYNSWHPPVMAWLLGLADRLVPGAFPFIVFQAALFFGAIGACAALRHKPSVIGLATLTLFMVSPLVLVYQGVVWKDVLFADSSIAGFAAIAWASRVWEERTLRTCLLAATFALFTFASLVRQNGVIIAACGVGALVCIAYLRARSTGQTRRASYLSSIACGLMAAAAIAIAGGTAAWELELHGDHRPETANEIKSLQVFDLAGAVHLRPTLPLPVLRQSAPALERFIRTGAVRTYSPTRIDTLESLPEADTYLAPEGTAGGAQWRNTIATSPFLYLRTRLEVFRWVFMTPDVRECTPVFTGVDPDHPELLREAGLSARYGPKDDWLSRYSEAFLDTPVFSHVLYAAVGLVLLILLGFDFLRDGNPELVALGGMLVAAFLFAASFFLIGIACDYRYLYFLDAAVMAAFVHRACAWRADEGGRLLARFAASRSSRIASSQP